MQLRVVHTTGYRYDGKAVASYNQARMTPVTTPEQIVAHSRLEVSPKPWVSEYRDYFGTEVTAFEVLDPHDSLTVTATSTVHVSRMPPPPATTAWEELVEPAIADRWTEYLTLPEIVEPPADYAARIARIRAEHETPGEAAVALCAMVCDEVEYRSGATQVSSPAAVAWRQRAGVNQDMAHLVIGGLRVMGIPARYVSGYLHPDDDPAIGHAVESDSHAWIEWWDDGWRGWDVARQAAPDDRYVTVAAGRDYTDVKPLAGIYSGAATSSMFVHVEVTRLA